MSITDDLCLGMRLSTISSIVIFNLPLGHCRSHSKIVKKDLFISTDLFFVHKVFSRQLYIDLPMKAFPYILFKMIKVTQTDSSTL